MLDIFERGEQARREGRPQRVFDWHKAARYIRDNKIEYAEAGLSEDYGWTSGVILRDGLPVRDSFTYLSSNWATPVLVLEDGTEIECWTYETEWDANTKWPPSAVFLLAEN